MGNLPSDWSLPAVNDTNRAWFTSGELAVQRCEGCGALQHPPEEICHACGAMAFTTEYLPPQGTVHSYTVVHHPVHDALAPAVPYTVVLVSVDAEPSVRVVGNLIGAPPGPVSIGMPVVATWEERTADDGTTVRLPQWRRAENEGEDVR